MKKSFWIALGLVTSGYADEIEKEKASWEVTCEVFSLPLMEAAKMKLSGESGAKDYARLVKLLKSGKVAQEEFLILRTSSNFEVVMEDAVEVIHPNEYEPPELPNQVGTGVAPPNFSGPLVTPALPSAFDTRRVGNTMEVELEELKEGQLNLALTLSLVSDLGRQVWGQGKSEAEMPRFAVQRLQTDFELAVDTPTLLGSISPPEALQPKDGMKRVWFAFVIVSEASE